MDGVPGSPRPAQDRGSGMRGSLLFLTALLVALPLTAARREKPKSADLSEPVVASPYRWQKMSEADGLTVFWSQVKGTQVVAYRMEGILKAPIGEVASLFHPPEGRSWMPLLIREEKTKGQEGVLRIETLKLGPFCSPREFLVHVTAATDPAHRGIVYTLEPVGAGTASTTTQLVQGDLTGSLHLTPMTFPDQTFLRAEFYCELNGKMPAWAVNLIEQSWPQKAFRALRTQVAQGNLKVSPEVEKLLATPPATLSKRKGRKPLRHR
jgi:hypothetical protein